MPARKQESSRARRPPATTPESRENQLISMAVDLAERQLADGTASSQVISHFLKRSSAKEKIEQDILKAELELIQAKTKAIKDAKDMKEMYTTALNAMKTYSGNGDDYDD